MRNRVILQKGDMEYFVDRLDIAEAVEGEREQFSLDCKTHQPGRHLKANQSRMPTLAADQRGEIERVVGYKNVAVVDRAAHDRPIPARPQPKPGDVRRSSMPMFTRQTDKIWTQTLVDQELHARTAALSDIVSDAFVGRNWHPAFARGRPRRG